MIKISIRKTLLIAILCLFTGLGLNSLFKGCNRSAVSLPENILPTTALKQKADTIESRHQEQIALLNRKNEELQHSLSQTSMSLRQSKAKLSAAEQSIRQLLTASVTNDSASALTACDTLGEYVKGYLDESIRKDSLYDSKISLLESTVTLKDSALDISANTEQQIRILLSQALQQHSWLETENLTLKGQIEKTQKKQKLLTLGLVLISGVAAGYLVTH